MNHWFRLGRAMKNRFWSCEISLRTLNMSDYQLGLSAVPLPVMHHVRQDFPAPQVADVELAVRAAVAGPEIVTLLRPGLRIAVAIGSRGIAGLAIIVTTLVTELQKRGCTVVIIPAMGSHGGGTPEGQLAVLANYGVTEATIGVPIINTMATSVVGALRWDALLGDYISDPAGELPVPVASDALACDLIIPVARIKPHTGFRGEFESGVCKMLCVGLGKHAGCSRYHREGYARFAKLMPAAAAVVLATQKIAFALAVVENYAEKTARIEAIPGGRIRQREPQLLSEARALMPRLLLPHIDVLVVERIGKEISGTGMDPSVTGRSEGVNLDDFSGPRIRRIVVLGLSEGTHGNASGIGLADIITERAFAAIDRRTTYTNVLTSGSLEAGKIPVALPDDDMAVRAALSCMPGVRPEDAIVVRIRDTLHLRDIAVSENALPSLRGRTDLTVGGVFSGFESA
jgi:hypothetical protein